MALRIPPGRAGRIWLVGRLEIAHRGAELLDRKRQALLREQAVTRAELERARAAWLEAAAEAARWSARATVLDGPSRLDQLSRHVDGRATLAVSWTNLMGARLPRAAEPSLPAVPALSALGAGAATVLAAHAARRATIAAARYAIAERAEAELTHELGRAARRLRALERRWIPQHEQALARLDLVLDENQREQAARGRRFASRMQTGNQVKS